MTSNNPSLGTALVTGASSGIGATYARKLAERGYDLVLVARDAARLNKLAFDLKQQYGVSADVISADLSLSADVQTVEARLRQDEAVTLLVNNAGIGPSASLLDSELSYLDRMIAINVTAVNRLAVVAAKAFKARGKGAIINIASVVALAPEIFNGTYSASKSYVLALTESLAHELADSGVRVQAVLPGLTRTEIFDRVGGSFDQIDPERVMDAGDMVSAALAGFDQGELITIPSLEDNALLKSFRAARGALGPHLSLRQPARRYSKAA